MAAPVEIDWSAPDFRKFLTALKEFDPKLATAVRRRLRQTGDEAAAEMKSTILAMPAAGDYGVRAAIASGITTRVLTGTRQSGVRIQASGSSLGSKRALVKAFNRASFRHPVFGNRSVWVQQSGQPYFGAVLARHRNAMYDSIVQAVEDAVATVNAV